MFNSRDVWKRAWVVLISAMCLQGVVWAQAPLASAQDRYPGAGRDATPREVAAWDIDVRPDRSRDSYGVWRPISASP